MRALLSRLQVFRPATPPPAPPPAPTLARALAALAAMEQKVADLQAELIVTKQRFEHARRAQAAIHRQSCALRKDWPQVYRRYFTNEGIAEREAGTPVNPRKKRKK